VRLFVKRGMEVFVAQSYSKNLGLYSERIGAINVVCSAPDIADRYSFVFLLIACVQQSPSIQFHSVVATA